MPSSVQLNFSLRTTPTVRSLHLVGSWDNYQSQLPMSQDPNKKKSSGAWTGTFKFQPGSLQPGARYWYYYIMDGYHVTHDPAREAVVEPTTKRKLNILDIPGSTSKSSSSSSSSSRQTKRSSRRLSVDIVKGRALSPSKIQSPRPYRPGQTSSITNETYNKASLEEIQARMARTNLNSDSESEDSSDSDSDDASDVPSLTSRSSASSRSSSVSNSSSCSCERYGITRSGNRIKLDCGGARCGYSDQDCSSESEEEVQYSKASKRHGVVIRGSA